MDDLERRPPHLKALFLRAAGYRVAVAYDGPQAVAAAPADATDVVILDIGLPGLDGYEVAERLRRDGRTEDVVNVAVSSYDRPATRAGPRAGRSTSAWSSR